ncbi:transposase [Desulfuromonas sp. CSMB_57]|uniref:transposase n=1 Tax=Desulfuromonas sp. CSMB_57 TaxID=2807629 RepID=UPI001CD5959A|nr:transposase [Desulfuromonas sp. CSMB_57]
MARANRHHIPGQVWHITHRCHKKEFLLKFARDRRRWLCWLFEAKKRFGLRILNYVVTSNHIHMLVVDSGPNVIAKSLQLIAGRTAQEFNQRKQRKGAYWEDRYHATAVEQSDHLVRCLVYIDLNMVRAGVVSHPSEWEMGGYNEIQNPPERYGLIDMPYLRELCGISDSEHFTEQYRQWIQEAIDNDRNQRESCWTESIAVGSVGFVEEIKARLGIKGVGRKVERQEASRFVLREESEAYSADFGPENSSLSANNSYFLDVLLENSID